MVCTFRPPGVSSASANSRRARARRLRVDAAAAGLAHRLVERGVVERGPLAERVEHAVRHVGGGGLGEGEAEDFRRIDAGEQQPDHALRQHVGLARAGIGRRPRPRRPGSDASCLHARCTAGGMIARRSFAGSPSSSSAAGQRPFLARAPDGRSRRSASSTSDAPASDRASPRSAKSRDQLGRAAPARGRPARRACRP